jgi:hypothetical protein
MERGWEDTQGNKLREVNDWCIHVVCPVVPSLLVRSPYSFIHSFQSFVYSSHRSIHWYRNRHIIKSIYIFYYIYTSSVNMHKTPVKMVTQSLWVNNIILYFSVCKSISGQELLRYRTCHDRKQVCIQYTQTYTFMITGQQKRPYKLHRQWYTEAKAEKEIVPM